MALYGDSYDIFPFLPERTQYSFNKADDFVVLELEGGISRRRKDYEGTPSTVNCTWVLTGQEYEYFMLFYRYVTQYGLLSFKAPLILDTYEIKEYDCRFVKDSVSLSNPSPYHFTVSATFEVEIEEDVSKHFGYFLRLRQELSDGVAEKGFYNFDGVDDVVTFPPIVLDADFSISCYLRLDGDSGSYSICGGGNQATGPSYAGFFGWNDSTKRWQLNPDLGGASWNFPVGLKPLFNGRLYHVAVTRTGTSGKLYIDGKLVSELVVTADSPFTIRQFGHSYNSTFLTKGGMSNFRLYSKGLTLNEISYIYTDEDAGDDPGTDALELSFTTDENSGFLAYDYSPTPTNGTIANIDPETFHSIGAPPDQIKSYLFNVNDTTQVTHPAITLGDATFAIWFKPYQLSGSVGPFGGGLFSTGGDYQTLIMFSVGANRWEVRGNSGGSIAYFTSNVASPVVNEWNHLAFTRAGSLVKIFFNGVEVDSRTMALVSNFTMRVFGETYNTALGVDGRLRDYHIYDRALTESEVLYVMTDGAQGTNPTLTNIKARFMMDEGSGFTAKDISGKGNNGSIASPNIALFHQTEDA